MRHMSQQQFSSCDKPLFAKKKFCCGENLSPQHIAWNFPGLNVCVAKQQQNDPNINVASKWALILQNVPLQHICMPLSASYAPACTLSLTMLLILTHQACPRNISSSVPTFESIPQRFSRAWGQFYSFPPTSRVSPTLKTVEAVWIFFPL